MKQEQILNQIQAYDTIIIHRHMRPDPDAIGSQVGLAEILRASFPNKTIYQVGGPVGDLDFLATMDEVSEEQYQEALVIVTDTANAPRISDDRYDLGKKLIKIDHHPNDEPYGDLMWVDPKASSCSEMIASFCFAHDELQMTDNAARLLYAGIVGDTGRFLYPATTKATFAIAGKLRCYDFDASKINRTLQQVPLKVARLSGYVYSNLEVDQTGAAKVVLTKELLETYHVSDAETSGLVPLPGDVEEVLAWALFVEQPEGYYRVRIRSKGPVINEIAKRHHGGGHPLASGANAKDKAEVAEIYGEILAACTQYRKADK
ncbi:bifunctional oligoribonuclease/PAP phosphatase NrnA [uncultured Enterococcus sp.]|uniref:DHH family phosphoesterase n=1 Tax=uncultured Enterococcus sp. TaxID=167972 RepID=UPI0025F374B7|nr:bifunctional oligoribonuclease/PAP phosphatase NrnA [uncultured Enterococcus sp.]